MSNQTIRALSLCVGMSLLLFLSCGSLLHNTDTGMVSQEQTGETIVIKVTDFGIKGDGKTDNTSRLRKLITSTQGYDRLTIVFPKGKYLVQSKSNDASGSGILIDRNNVTLRFEDGAEIVLRPNASPKYAIILIKNADNVTIEGGILTGDRLKHDYSVKGTHEFGFGILVDGSRNVSINKTRIRDVTGDGIMTYGINTSDKYIPSSDIVINECSIERVRRNGISVVLGERVSIINNTITDTGVTDSKGNDGTAPMTGIDIEGGSRPKHILIEKNKIIGSVSDAITVFNGNYVTVRENYLDRPIAYQYASNVLIEGNSLDITRGKTNRPAIGRTADEPALIGEGTMLATESLYEIVSRATLDFRKVGAPNNKVGTMFICTKALALRKGDSVRIHFKNFTITKNKISGTIDGISSNPYSDDMCIISDNDINVVGTGIGAQNAKVLNNRVKTGGMMGLVIRSSEAKAIIEGNTFEDSMRGIYIPSESIESVVIKKNTFKNPKPAYATCSMIQGSDAPGIELIDNHIENNSRHPMNYAVSGVTSIKGNTIINGNGSGVCLSMPSVVSDNIIKASDTGVVANYKQSVSSTISKNTITAKTHYADKTKVGVRKVKDVLKSNTVKH